MKKLKKIEPNTPKWESMANQIARDMAPVIRSCRNCGRPVAHGYCCTWCESVNP